VAELREAGRTITRIAKSVERDEAGRIVSVKEVHTKPDVQALINRAGAATEKSLQATVHGELSLAWAGD